MCVFLCICFYITPCWAADIVVGGTRISKKVKTLKEIKHEKIVSQSLDFSCGAAGLSTLLKYYHNDAVNEGEIINALLTKVPLQKIKERKGFSLLDLKNFAESRGYQVTGFKTDIDFIKTQKKPFLVPVRFRNYSHFVIIKAVVADRVFIADPAAGNMTMKINKFNKIWTNGIALLIEKPGEGQEESGLEPEEKDLLITSYQSIKRTLDPRLIRTTIFPYEF